MDLKVICKDFNSKEGVFSRKLYRSFVFKEKIDTFSEILSAWALHLYLYIYVCIYEF